MRMCRPGALQGGADGIAIEPQRRLSDPHFPTKRVLLWLFVMGSMRQPQRHLQPPSFGAASKSDGGRVADPAGHQHTP
jgi:hypothetical protein